VPGDPDVGARFPELEIVVLMDAQNVMKKLDKNMGEFT